MALRSAWWRAGRSHSTPVSSGLALVVGQAKRSSSASGGSRFDPRGGQLDRQRQAVQPAADLGDDRRVVAGEREVRVRGARALDEQAHAVEVRRAARSGRRSEVGHRQRRHGDDVFGGQVQHLAAGDQDLQRQRTPPAARRPGAACWMTCSKLSSTSSMPCACSASISVVQQRLARDFTNADGFADRRRQQVRSVERRERQRKRRRAETRPAKSSATCSARRVLPVPAAPVSVSSRVLACSRRWRRSRSSCSRPTKLVNWTGRLCGEALSERSGGKSAGRSRVQQLEELVRLGQIAAGGGAQAAQRRRSAAGARAPGWRSRPDRTTWPPWAASRSRAQRLTALP